MNAATVMSGCSSRRVASLKPIHVAAMLIAHVCVRRIGGNRRPHRALGAIEIARTEQEIPEMRLKTRSRGLCSSGMVGRRDCIIDATGAEQHVAQINLENRYLRRARNRLSDHLLGGGEVAGLHQYGAELGIPMRIIWLGFDRLPACRDGLGMTATDAQHVPQLA